MTDDQRTNGSAGQTRVGVCKQDATDVYVGRGDGGRSMHDTDIGTRGWLGNPYSVEDGYTRAEAIELFRQDFKDRLWNDDEFRAAVRELAGDVLGCWCQPLEANGPPCHAEVIAEYADRLAKADISSGYSPDIQLYLCERCGGDIRPGHEIISLTDGYADADRNYEVTNRRVWHGECWQRSQYMNTDTGTPDGGPADE